jgi:ABC-type siderophore export system fused ATPase/permease subunit
MTKYHKLRYFNYKKIGTYFKLPTIAISSIASVASVGLTSYLSQANISGIVCLMTLTVSVINSIELYMKITETIELELDTSKKYYQLSIDIHKILKLDRENRKISGADALEKFYRDYTELFEASALISNSYIDNLALLPKKGSIFKRSKSSTGSSNSSINSNPMLDNEPDTPILTEATL